MIDEVGPGERLMTVGEFVRSEYFDDGWELCRGELIAMSSAGVMHELVVMRLRFLFLGVIGKRMCWVFGSNFGVKLDEIETFVMPDVSVNCDGLRAGVNWFLKSPELVVEVLSGTTKNYDMGEKRELYCGGGAREYWMIDLEEKWVEVENFELEKIKRSESGEIVRSWLFPEFEFEVDEIFDVVG
jgi:Uma2 family endonuclease